MHLSRPLEGLTYLQRKVGVLPEVKPGKYDWLGDAECNADPDKSFLIKFNPYFSVARNCIRFLHKQHDGINIFIAIPQVMIKLFL